MHGSYITLDNNEFIKYLNNNSLSYEKKIQMIKTYLKDSSYSKIGILLQFDEKTIYDVLIDSSILEMYTSDVICTMIKIASNEYKIKFLKNENILSSLNIIDIISIIDFINDIDIKTKIVKNKSLINRFNEFTFLRLFLLFEINDQLELLKDLNVAKKLGDYCIDVITKFKESHELYILCDALLCNNVFDNVEVDKFKLLIPYLPDKKDILLRVINSNNSNFRNIGLRMILPLFSQNKSIEEINSNLDEIEGLFINDDLPLFAKVFICFKKLYPDLSKLYFDGGEIFDFSNNSLLSPCLLDDNIMKMLYSKRYEEIKKRIESDELFRESFNKKATEVRFGIIFNDLLRISINSCDKSLKKYLENIEIGNVLFMLILKNNSLYYRLDDEDKSVLEKFISYLDNIYISLGNNRLDKNLFEKISFYSDYFKVNDRYDLKDRIVRSFCYYGGYKSFEQLKSEFNSVIEKTNQKNIENERRVLNGGFKLEEGDFLRCIGSVNNLTCLNEGNVCKELLGINTGRSESDLTPLDTDFTRITKDDLADTLYDTIKGTPSDAMFGDIFFIIKKDSPSYMITRDENGISEFNYNPRVTEMFMSKESNHYGARIGTSTSDIDYIIYNETYIDYDEKTSSIDKISFIKNSLVDSGFYIPVIDISGNLIFTYDEFMTMSQNKKTHSI